MFREHPPGGSGEEGRGVGIWEFALEVPDLGIEVLMKVPEDLEPGGAFGAVGQVPENPVHPGVGDPGS